MPRTAADAADILINSIINKIQSEIIQPVILESSKFKFKNVVNK